MNKQFNNESITNKMVSAKKQMREKRRMAEREKRRKTQSQKTTIHHLH